MQAKSIRPFIGASNFDLSRRFYQDLGFTETVLSISMSVFKTGNGLAFYLQDASVRDWIDNTMVFLEVENVEQYYRELEALDIVAKYEGVRLTAVKNYDWGSECFMHDPSGILWHFGAFIK